MIEYASQSLCSAEHKEDGIIFAGDMRLGKNSYRLANVQKEPP